MFALHCINTVSVHGDPSVAVCTPLQQQQQQQRSDVPAIERLQCTAHTAERNTNEVRF